MPEEPTPSPYLGELAKPSQEDEALIKEVEAICLSHGYRKFFILFSKGDDDKKTVHPWKGFSNIISERMVEYLEMFSRSMRETIIELKKRL